MYKVLFDYVNVDDKSVGLFLNFVHEFLCRILVISSICLDPFLLFPPSPNATILGCGAAK